MNTPIWFEKFKEKLSSLEEDFASSGEKTSMLGYAFQTNRIDSEEYLAWAMTQYELPKLHKRFLTEAPPSQEVFAKWATHFLWSVECLPVAEWDGSPIVACLEPPQDFPSSLNAIFVLTSYEDLQTIWDKYHPSPNAVLDIPMSGGGDSPSAMPEGMDLSIATVVSAKSDSFSFEDLGMDNNTPNEISEANTNSGVVLGDETPAATEGLEGINFDAPTKVFKLEALSGPVIPEASPQEATAIFKAPVEEKAPEVKIPPPPSQAPVAPVTPKPVINSPLSTKLPPTKTSAAAAAFTPPTAPKAPPVPVAPVAGIPGRENAAATPVRPAVRAVPSVSANAPLLLEALKKKNGSALDEKVKFIFEEMRNHFEKSLILTLDEKESQLMVFAWDEGFKGMKDPAVRVPLQTPSIFNIVASTQKPFHGYISLNETNEKFFEDWNQGRIPDHITIAPLILGDKMVGMLMGFAEKSAYNKMSLALAEKMSGEFVKNLKAA